MSSIRYSVFLAPISILIAATVASLIDMDAFFRAASGVNTWILDTFVFGFAWGALGLVLLCAWVAISPLGRVRIGGKHAKPLLSRWNWAAITLCTTIAVGIIFWASAEAVFHFYEPGGRPIEPGSDEAARFTMTTLFMHWTITPYAIYTVPSLAFALAYYNLGKPFSLSGPLSVLVGRDLKGPAADFIDMLALVTLALGMSASLGIGMLSLAGGLGSVAPISETPLVLAGITIAIVVTFLISSITGLQKGIRYLSDINTRFLFVFAGIILLLGPTWDILANGVMGLMGYVAEFPERSLLAVDAAEQEWSKQWTVFYWANWLSWAPITALFLGRISRGYTVREFIAINLVAPAIFSGLWVTILGGATLEANLAQDGALNTVLQEAGPGAILYALIDTLPFATVLAVTLLFLSFISYVTAADSNTDAIAFMCHKPGMEDQGGRTTMIIKLTWAGMIGACAWIMTSYSGVDGIRMLSNLGGLPALFIVLAMGGALILLSTRYVGRLQDT